MKEKMIESEYKFEGKIIKIKVDKVELSNGNTSYREICEHLGGVGVLALDDDKNVTLVRQFRYAYNEEILEIPAGKIDSIVEKHLDCGIRELKEETGITASKITYLGKIYPSVGFLTEVIHLYLAENLQYGEQNLDVDEFVEIVKMPFNELCDRIASGEITDAKTITAVFKTKLLLEKR